MAVHQGTGARKVRDSLRMMSTVKPAGSQGRCRRVRSILWLACSDSGLPKFAIADEFGAIEVGNRMGICYGRFSLRQC